MMSGGHAPEPGSADRAAIMRLSADWLAAERRQDVPSLLELVTDDAVFLLPNGQSVAGKAAIGTMFRAYFASFSGDHQATTDEVQIVGDWAFTWGRENTTLTPVRGGDPIALRGFGLSILRRGADGQWRFARGINNLALQPPGPINQRSSEPQAV